MMRDMASGTCVASLRGMVAGLLCVEVDVR